MNKKYLATIDGQYEALVSRETIDLSNIVIEEDGCIHLIHGGRSYRAELASIDLSSKTVNLKVNDATFSVKLKDDLDQLVTKMGMKANFLKKSADVVAPMPGLVLKIFVEEGQEVNEGDPVVILEAMKMENVLKAEGSGIVKKINASDGESVEKGVVLIEVEGE